MLGCRIEDLIISIHAPARGATGGYGKAVFDGVKFQSTLPRGERLTDQ